jgi:beta-xylosidase
MIKKRIAILLLVSLFSAGVVGYSCSSGNCKEILQEYVTVNNPVVQSDFPDPSVIYVDGAFYMTSTSMHFMPGIPILRSYDLAHWEIVSYVYDTLLDNPAHNLQNGKNIYGQGSWATSFRYHNGYFYVCFNSNDAQSTFVYRTKDILSGPWERVILPGMHHDPSLLFDDDGRTYIVYGNGTIYIKELTEDAMAFKPNGVNQILVDTPKVEGLNCEGSHIEKINGRYYLMLIQWPSTGTARRIQWCYRSDTLLGDYTGKVVLDDNMGYKNNGVAQGGLFYANGEWYAMLFQDRDALGRSPVLMPVKWEDGWPILGINGKAPKSFKVPYKAHIGNPILADDEFNYLENKLSLVWEWNHNPDPAYWSVILRKGYLRLTNGTITPCFEQARNTLTQHSMGPSCAFYTKLDTSGMKTGDYAGIAALQYHSGLIGISYGEESKNIVLIFGEGEKEKQITSIPYNEDSIYLKIYFDFLDGIDMATFSYSVDGKSWHQLDEKLKMIYSLEHFTGYRPALFSYATKTTGGYADFDFMRVECPNAAAGFCDMSGIGNK